MKINVFALLGTLPGILISFCVGIIMVAMNDPHGRGDINYRNILAPCMIDHPIIPAPMSNQKWWHRFEG
jgi:hypothetical protein